MVPYDPKMIKSYIFLSDKKSKKPRSITYYRLSVREMTRITYAYAEWCTWGKQSLKKQKSSEKEGEAFMDEIISCTQDQLHGWKNIVDLRTEKAIPFKKELLEDVLSSAELWEVFFAIRYGAILEVSDAKKSKSRSRSKTGNSVKAARKK